MNSAHGYTEGAEVPQQAQADKANEGREEKLTDEGWSDIRLLVKRIWSRAYLDTEEKHIGLIKDHVDKELRDQLSKELENSKIKEEELTAEWAHGYNSAMREANEQLEKEREEVRRSHGLISALEQSSASQAQDYHDKFTELINEREKEREMKKELVEAIIRLCNRYVSNGYVGSELHEKIESLIKKATELGKN